MDENVTVMEEFAEGRYVCECGASQNISRNAKYSIPYDRTTIYYCNVCGKEMKFKLFKIVIAKTETEVQR